MSDDFRILDERRRLLRAWRELQAEVDERVRLAFEDRRRTEQAREARKEWLKRREPTPDPGDGPEWGQLD